MRILLVLVLAFGVCAGVAAQTSPAPAGTPPATATNPAVAPAAPANPYSATVPVVGTGDAQRNEAIAAALAVVLQQVSPGFVPAAGELTGASGYVRDYHYRRAASGAGLELQVDFDPTAVTRLLAQQGGTNATAAATPTVAAGTAPATAGTSATPMGQAQAATSGTATVWVGGIDSTHAFASLLSALRGDPQLHDVIPVAAAHDGLLLQVGYSQPLAAVLAALETPAGHLTQALQPHAGADATLHWNP